MIATISTAPSAAGQATSTFNGPAATKPASVSASTASGARGSGGIAPRGVRPGASKSRRKTHRSAPHSIAIATAHGSAISAAKRAKDNSVAWNASRLVRFEIGSSSDAELARCAHA